MSDSGGNGLAPAAGIGLLAGSCCPHYSSEPQRQAAFAACIARGDLPDGIAIDDGVAVLVDGTGRMSAFSTRPRATARRVWRIDGVTHCAPIAPSIQP